jgi:TldD protein
MIDKFKKLFEKSKASFADLRIQKEKSELLLLRNKQISTFNSNENQGLGIRVFYKNAWGFACSTDFSDLEDVFKKAEKLAFHWSKKTNQKKREIKTKVNKGNYKTKYKLDPFAVDSKEKLDLLKKINTDLRKNKKIKTVDSFFGCNLNDQTIVNSCGSKVNQKLLSSMIGFSAVGRENDNIQRSFDRFHYSAGYEIMEKFDLNKKIKNAKEHIDRLLNARTSPAGFYPVILDGSMTGVLFH